MRDDERPFHGQHVGIDDDLEEEGIRHAVDRGPAKVETEERSLRLTRLRDHSSAEELLRFGERRGERCQLRLGLMGSRVGLVDVADSFPAQRDRRLTGNQRLVELQLFFERQPTVVQSPNRQGR